MKDVSMNQGWNYGKIKTKELAANIKVEFPKDRSKFKSMKQRDYEKRRAEFLRLSE